MNRILTLALIAITLISCKDNTQKADAYGNFEADEVRVSSETMGKILILNIEEGAIIEKNQIVGLVDTIMPSLQLSEINAQRLKINANINSIESQTDILIQQKENITIDINRIENMAKTGAATQKQLDDAHGNMKIIEKQISANRAQKQAVITELKVLESKKQLLREQLNRCEIKNPIRGTVLEKYAEQGEITASGKPLYKIADTDLITLRCYISGGQLHEVILNNSCKVLVDKGKKEFLEYDGTITWISSKAEFTPKIIQTKDERVSMVYAVKIKVKNNGSIKIGMPGEVVFSKQ